MMKTHPEVSKLYSQIRSLENKLGGGAGIDGMYGSITQSSMQKVLDCLRHQCQLDACSVLVDIGSGLARPLLHAIVDIGVSGERTFGIEVDMIKCEKAAIISERSYPLSPPRIICSPIEDILTLDPVTHAYSFWEGINTEARCVFGRLFRESRTLTHVCIVQRFVKDIVDVMDEYGFGILEPIEQIKVSMSGSGSRFWAFVLKKKEIVDNMSDKNQRSIETMPDVKPSDVRASKKRRFVEMMKR